MPRRRYTAAEKAAAVGLALAKGQRPAAEELGVPLSSLHVWYQRPEFAQIRTTAREDVAEQMWVGVQIGIAETVKGLRDPDARLRDKSDATSMLVEKYLLLTGQATNRTETKDITSRFTDHEMDMLADAIDAEIKRRETA
jgi:transposase-like protein